MSFDDIKVLNVDEDTGLITFKIQAKKVSGLDKLVQVVVLALLNSPGRDVLDPDRGSGIPTLVGSNIDPNDSTEIFAEVAQRVMRTQAEIIDSQIGLDESDEEQLREIKIINIERGGSIDEIFVRLKIINEAGQQTSLVV